MYRDSKFSNWRELLTSGGGNCKRTFRSLLKMGLITRLYDPVAFASPESERSEWQVTQDNGKVVDIPRCAPLPLPPTAACAQAADR